MIVVVNYDLRFRIYYSVKFIKYIITPCASATAIGGTIDYVSIEYSASKAIGSITGVTLYFFRQIDIAFL